MAAKTVSQLIIDLRDEIKTDPNGKIWRDRELRRFLSRAYLKIQADAMFNFPENQAAPTALATVGGTQEYNLPASFGRMVELVIASSNYPLEIISLDKLYSLYPQQSEAGTPTRFYLRNDKIGLHPIPDAVYTLTQIYRKKFAFPTVDTQVIDYDDDEVADTMVKYASYLAWSSPRGNRATAVEKLQDYKELLSALKHAKMFRSKTFSYKTVRNTGQYFNPRGLNY